MEDCFDPGLDLAVDQMEAGLVLLEIHIERGAITESPILCLRDNLRYTIATWRLARGEGLE